MHHDVSFVSIRQVSKHENYIGVRKRHRDAHARSDCGTQPTARSPSSINNSSSSCSTSTSGEPWVPMSSNSHTNSRHHRRRQLLHSAARTANFDHAHLQPVEVNGELCASGTGLPNPRPYICVYMHCYCYSIALLLDVGTWVGRFFFCLWSNEKAVVRASPGAVLWWTRNPYRSDCVCV